MKTIFRPMPYAILKLATILFVQKAKRMVERERAKKDLRQMDGRQRQASVSRAASEGVARGRSSWGGNHPQLPGDVPSP